MARLKYILKTRDFTQDFRSSDLAKLDLVKYTIEEMRDGVDSANGYAWYYEIHNAIENGENTYGAVLADIDRDAERRREW